MRRKKKESQQVSKRPANVAFKQQRLAAWQPILTPRTVLPALFLIGLIFLPLGAVFLVASNSVTEVTVDYTNCTPAGSTTTCADLIGNPSTIATVPTCTCTVDVTVPKDIDGQVYLYYKLERFFQNHRRYVKSRDDSQLHGRDTTVASNCDPLDVDAAGNTYAPCGYIANSMFNDTISLSTAAGAPINMNADSIAWNSDANEKFMNPASWAGTVQPPNWNHTAMDFPSVVQYPELNQGYINQDFIVWMRTAALPTFLKLYRKLDAPLPAGDYQFQVEYNFPVSAFDGKKLLVLTNTSWLGGRNAFLGIAYIVVGALVLLVASGLLARHLIAPRQLGDHKYLAWGSR